MEETTLLYHCRALCMDEADTLLDNAFVVVQGATIRSVGTERPAGPFAHEIDCRGNVLMPGLVNAHTHIPMTLLRGYGGGCDLQTWLNDWIFPAEAKLDDRAVKAGAEPGPGRADRQRRDHHRRHVHAHPRHRRDGLAGGHQRQPLLRRRLFRRLRRTFPPRPATTAAIRSA